MRARGRRLKRLVFCFDGSWNRLDAPHPTNVLLTAESVLPLAGDRTAQVTFYDEGVGSENGEAIVGGLFGAGLVKNLSDGYRFLIFNYSPGDEIYVFGFSRGAYTARSFVGLLTTCGILHRQHARWADEAVALYKRRSDSEAFRAEVLTFRAEHSPQIVVSEAEDEWRAQNLPGYVRGARPQLSVRYLGVWDTVGALGIPRYIAMADAFNKGHQFHDVSLSPVVEHARHAVAIDETKVDFEPALWGNLDELNRARGFEPDQIDAPYQQMWFPGQHGSVGGGGERRGLSDQALDWIWDGARHAGLELDSGPDSHLYQLIPSHAEALANRPKTLTPVTLFLDSLPKADRKPAGQLHVHEISPIARRRWREQPEKLPEAKPYRPGTLQPVAPLLDTDLDGDGVPDMEGYGPEFTIYIVRPGDTLARIARRAYGSPRRIGPILAANRTKLLGPNALVHAGQALRLPVRKT